MFMQVCKLISCPDILRHGDLYLNKDPYWTPIRSKAVHEILSDCKYCLWIWIWSLCCCFSAGPFGHICFRIVSSADVVLLGFQPARLRGLHYWCSSRVCARACGYVLSCSINDLLVKIEYAWAIITSIVAFTSCLLHVFFPPVLRLKPWATLTLLG